MLDSGIAYAKAHPKIAIAGGVVAVGVGVLALRARSKEAAQTDAALVSPTGAESYPVGNPLGGTQPGTIAGVAYTPGPARNVPIRPTKKPGLITVILNSLKTGDPYTATLTKLNDPTQSCPSGYVLVVGSTGHPECISANQPATGSRYAPIIHATSKTAKGGTPKAAGEGEYAFPRLSSGEVPLGFVDRWTAKHAMQLYTRAETWGYDA